jgi:hypothetical protein
MSDLSNSNLVGSANSSSISKGKGISPEMLFTVQDSSPESPYLVFNSINFLFDKMDVDHKGKILFYVKLTPNFSRKPTLGKLI